MLLPKKAMADSAVSPKTIKPALKKETDTIPAPAYQEKSWRPVDFLQHI